MEESKALHKLSEVADLIAMVEDMLSPSTSERLSPSAWSGIRITLRGIKESVQASHAVLSSELLSRSRANLGTQQTTQTTQINAGSTHAVPPVMASTLSGEAQRIQMTRRDLKASIEKVVERGNL